ncbi:MFS transporter [Chamaesiphon minutus]|uniref:MFS transporter n=1 Tax=Chamaesiphon minutus TaxID=1173032 RepID=UPI0002F422D5|nr:MFS transporter [Chamaesiphon minutus]
MTSYQRILWRQLWGLGALVAAIIFSWMAYSFYQPVILTNLGFIHIAQSLGIIQGFLGAAIEPIVGMMSDRLMHRVGSRLPGIAVGITLAGLLFVAIGLLLHGSIAVWLRWTIPVLMTFWTVAMIVFRGPAIALIRQTTPTEALPAASSILTFIFGLIGAIGPIFERIITALGSGNTFLLGAVMLVLSAILLWSSKPELNSTVTSAIAKPTMSIESSLARKIRIFGMGLVAGILVNILLRVCPQRLHASLFVRPQ